MSDDGLRWAADRFLASFDFSRATAAATEAHRRELVAILTDFLAVVDSLEALQRISECDEAITRRTCRMILRQAVEVLHRAGVVPIECLGKPLDLANSEVVDVRVDELHTADTVVEEVVRGYFWRGQLLRHAKVAIARGQC